MVTLKLKEDEPLLYAHAEAVSSAGTGASTIRNTHSNIVCTARTVNGVLTPILQKEYSPTGRTALHVKLATARGAALMSACLAVDGTVLDPKDGICHATPEGAIRNMGRISNPGMAQTDRTIWKS